MSEPNFNACKGQEDTMNDPIVYENLQYLRRCLTAAQADPTNPFLVTQLEAAVSIHSAAEYLADRERRRVRDLKQATLPEGYTLLRGENQGYQHGWTAPNGKRYGFWVSRETAREEAWNHRDTPDEFDDPGELADVDEAPIEQATVVSSSGDVLSGCYIAEQASEALVARFKIASEHIDTWTWRELRQRDLESVHMYACSGFDASSLRAGGRLCMRQSSIQQLPWEPCMIIIECVTPPAISDEESEIRSLLSAASPRAAALAEGLLEKLPPAPPPTGIGSVTIAFWSAASHEVEFPDVARMTQIGSPYRLSDFEPVAQNRYLAPWPKLFGCGDKVIPDTRALFAQITIDDASDFEIKNVGMCVVKSATYQAKRWHDIYTKRIYNT